MRSAAAGTNGKAATLLLPAWWRQLRRLAVRHWTGRNQPTRATASLLPVQAGSKAWAPLRANAPDSSVVRIHGAGFPTPRRCRGHRAYAANLSIRERNNLRVRFGGRRGRKLKGVALVRFPNGKSTALSYIGMRPMAWVGARCRSNAFWESSAWLSSAEAWIISMRVCRIWLART